MTMDDFPLHPHALAAFHALPEADQNLVLRELSRWWPQPRRQWPAERLLSWSSQPGMALFCIDDRWGVTIQWRGEQPVEITALMRRKVEVVSTAPETPALRNPDGSLVLGGRRAHHGTVLLVIVFVVVYDPQQGGDAFLARSGHRRIELAVFPDRHLPAPAQVVSSLKTIWSRDGFPVPAALFLVERPPAIRFPIPSQKTMPRAFAVALPAPPGHAILCHLHPTAAVLGGKGAS